MELIVTQVQRRVDWLERLKINVDALFFAVVSQDSATVQHQAVIRNAGIQLELLLSRCDCS